MTGASERTSLVANARGLLARYEEEFPRGTWLDGLFSMLRRLTDVVEEDGGR